jgi:hypothetical protein
MKKIIIISSYATTSEKEKTLNDCIDKVSNKGYDIMLASHYPVPDYIQKKVNYCIYDSDNILLPYDISPSFWIANEQFYIEVNINSHNLTICRNMLNGIGLSKIMKYDFFFFMESDNIFSDDNFTKLDDLSNQMLINNKHLIFFKNQWISEHNESHVNYETLIYGGKVNYFLDNMPLPSTIIEYIQMYSPNKESLYNLILEKIFFNKLSHLEEQIFIINESSKTFFSNSIINKYFITNICDVVVSNIDNNYILFISNFSGCNMIYEINSITKEFFPGMWHFNGIHEDTHIVVKSLDGEILDRKSFIVSEFDRNKISEKANLYFK